MPYGLWLRVASHIYIHQYGGLDLVRLLQELRPFESARGLQNFAA